MARLLLLHGADVFAHFPVDGWTALHSACHGGHDHIAKLLVEEVREMNVGLGWVKPLPPKMLLKVNIP